MRKILFILFIGILSFANGFAQAVDYDDDHIVWTDQNLHLRFMLDKRTFEASVGTGISKDDHNAIANPPLDDPWWDDTRENLWDDIIIPSTIECNGNSYTVTKVASNAFNKSTYVHHVTLPSTIKEIASNAFNMCTYLLDVTLNEGLENIGLYAFETCIKLNGIHLPSTVVSIGAGAFMDCTALTSINIPGNCTQIANDTFAWCIALEELTIEDGDKELGIGYLYTLGPVWEYGMAPHYYKEAVWRGMFADSPLKNIYIGRNITITEPLVEDYSPFEKIYQTVGVNDKVITQHTGKSIDKVVFGNKVTNITKSLFRKANIQDVTLPPNVEVIEEYAFYQGYNSSNLVIPASCTSIGKRAFEATNSGGTIKTIEVKSTTPPSVDEEAFWKCYGFQVAVPGGTREAYMNDSYWGQFFIYDVDDKLVDITVRYAGQLYGRLAFEDMEPTDVYRLKVSGKLGTDDWDVIQSMTNLYELDLSDVEAETLTGLGSITSRLRTLKFPKGLKEVSDRQFEDGHLTGKIVIPESCTKIGQYAFVKCDINQLIIEGPTTISQRAFSFCGNLAQVSILGDGAVAEPESFYCVKKTDVEGSGLKSVTIGSGVTIQGDAFQSCNLQEIIIDGQVKYIGKGAFATSIPTLRFNGCVENYEVELHPDELFIDDLNAWAMMSFGSNTLNPISFAQKIYINGEEEPVDVVLPETITEIGDYCFYGCPLIREITLPQNTARVGDGAFSKCPDLTKIHLSDALNNIGKSAFADCPQLNSLNIPVSLKTIEERTFQNCAALQDISLPRGVEDISNYAFAGCTSLAAIELPRTLKTIGAHAFENCTAITKVEFPYTLESIGEMAFASCSELKRLEAEWIDPITVPTTAFNSISRKGILWVPVGTVENYYEKGWGRIPLIDEGFCILKSNLSMGGYLDINGMTYESGEFTKVEIGEDAEIKVVTTDDCYVTNFLVDGNDVMDQLQNDRIVIRNIENNKLIDVTFKKYLLGDVNDDDYIDVGDISAIVSFIQQAPSDNYVAKAADVNRDGDIDVGDITGTVNLIYENASQSSHKIKWTDYAAAEDSYILKAQLDTEGVNNTNTMHIGLDNYLDAYGIQFELTLPSGFFIPKDSEGNYVVTYEDERVGKMNIKSVTLLPNGNYLFLCSSTSKVGINYNSGNMLNIALGQESSLNTSAAFIISNIKFSDENADVYHQNEEIILTDQGIITNEASHFNYPIERVGKHIRNGHITIFSQGKRYSIDGCIENAQ